MFICSMRAGTIRFFCIVALALAVLVTLIALVPSLSPAAAANGEISEAEEKTETIRFEKIRTNEDRIVFLEQFGWKVENTPLESTTVTIPREFDKVFASYNELQRKEGLDLSAYAGRTVERYTYLVTNYDGYEGRVYANLLVCRDRVIGGDICAAESDGFLQGFTK